LSCVQISIAELCSAPAGAKKKVHDTLPPGEGYQTRINAYLRELMYRLRPRRRVSEAAEAGRVRQPLARHDRPKRAHR